MAVIEALAVAENKLAAAQIISHHEISERRLVAL
jgi:hypothetical protein